MGSGVRIWIHRGGGTYIATSPIPAGPFSVRAKQPVAIGTADQVLIDIDGFRFGNARDTGSIEWGFVLPFSEISELEYKATGGRVSGTLQDGTELAFRIDQVLAGEEAMRAVEALFDPQAGPDVESVDVRDSGDGRPVEWPQSVEAAFADAAECDAEPQVRRFARLTAYAGLEVDWSKNQRRLDANLPGTKKTAFAMYWIPKGRLNMGVYRTGGFGVGESEALRGLPKIRAFHPMDPQETDRFLDALEVFLAAHPLMESPDHSKADEIVDASQEPAPRRLRVRSVQIVSDEELAEAMRPLEKRFDKAAEYGVEPQARRFAELTAAADLDVRWNGRGLDAVWRRTKSALFYLNWDYRGWAKGGLGVDGGNTEFGSWSKVRAEEAFDWEPNRRGALVDAVPAIEYAREMDATEINRTTDLFLDWLQEFLASHALPSREDEAILQKELRLSNRSGRALTLALLTPIWGILSVFLLLLLPGQFPFNEPVGLVIQGLLFSVAPILAVVMGLKARRYLLEDDSAQSRSSRSAIRTAWVAIILGTLITVGFFAGYGIALMRQLIGNS